MLEGLHSNYAISGLALQWFRSYLADRHFSVCVRNETSDKMSIEIWCSAGVRRTPVVYPLHKTPW